MNAFSYGESHPGIRLGELLRQSPEHTHENLAKRLGVSTYRLRTLLKGTKGVEMELALKLACIFPEHTARDWLDMQVAHDLHQAYASGQMDAIAREMGAENRNISKVDWLMELKHSSDSLKIPLRYPLNHKLAALSENLKLPPQDTAVKAIELLWQQMDQGELTENLKEAEQ